MPEEYFINELASYIGSDIEINTNRDAIDGLLEEVKGKRVTIVELVDYNSKKHTNFSIDEINFVRIL
ncbi:DUF2642 domain-containing protein [Heyndrickxia sporothermodurans]|uniref:Uncharacterized protein n=1 Tax=Heyndrickxia sporothermodurans TaxID=46224 RepID=A0A150KK10_9BACI|nr:DUF2642 domain-containing protein [Heyndrickxia sporothermodurans]KYC87135.1 hypothetical protein B4102_4070 [Heyndrickxia sporothermodurans]MEB6550241.1 DUF2642 domain-containing protein [Heyndrickxia sporothermodurans]